MSIIGLEGSKMAAILEIMGLNMNNSLRGEHANFYACIYNWKIFTVTSCTVRTKRTIVLLFFFNMLLIVIRCWEETLT